MKKIFLLLFVTALFSVSCNVSSESSSEVIDTPTSGTISISVDETLQPIADAEVDVFQHQYPNAKVNVRYRSETDCVKDLYNDSCKLILIGRQLSETELQQFKTITLNPPHVKVATDAIALVVNRKNQDTVISYKKMMQILRGEDATKNVVFDGQNSGTVSYILGKTSQKSLPKNAFNGNTNLGAVNYVATHENAIGVIGWSWISDSDDPKTKEYLSKVNLVSIAPKDSAKAGEFYKPYQLYLAQGKYPLTRDVYMIQRERRSGLATGLTTFVYSEIGQTILLKAGLLPANQQDRWIEISTKKIGKVNSQ